MFNVDLALAALNKEFKKDDRIRVQNVLMPAYADEMATLVSQDTAYATIINLNNQGRVLYPSELAGMSVEQQQQMQTSLMAEAREGRGYCYHGHQIAKSNNGALKKFLETLNAPKSLEIIRRITGATDIAYADGQATRYLPGHYLTRHLDNPAGESRRYAYVFSLTKDWHPDWGGLLQFYERDGTPREAWAPRYNTLSLFDVRHVHAVTYVTPFAGVARHSITGWFRT